LPPLTIRPATIDDLDTVVAFRVALLREHWRNAVYKRLRPDIEERARRLFAEQLGSANEISYLAERGRDPVGILRCVETIGSPLLFPARYAYISSVYVRPAERRGGVLRELLGAAERWCRDRGLGEMRLHNAADNETANAAWQALGFHTVEVLRIRTVSAAGWPAGDAAQGAAGERGESRDRGKHDD
jgi:ribosomal protein S18 acetylase RimI-like enzyme